MPALARVVRFSALLRAAALLAILGIGCAPRPTEGLRPAGWAYITSAPEVATAPLSVSLTTQAGEVLLTSTFKQGEKVIAQLATTPGAYSLTSAGCAVPIDLKPDRELDIVLDLSSPTCSWHVTAEHKSGESGHVMGTATIAFTNGDAPAGATVEMASLDEPPNPNPSPIARDESNRFYFSRIIPGRYRISVVLGDVLLGSTEVKIQAEPARNDVRITLSSP